MLMFCALSEVAVLIDAEANIETVLPAAFIQAVAILVHEAALKLTGAGLECTGIVTAFPSI